MDLGKVLAAGILGAILIALGFEISITSSFETRYVFDRNPAWGFGPRELAHCVGFAGCTLVGWSLIRSFATPRGRRANLTAAIAGLCCFPVLLVWPDLIPFKMELGLRKFICTVVIPFYLIGTVLLLQFVKDWPSLAQAVPAALISAMWVWLWSITWEVGIQPHQFVYEGPPRGYIQWAQLLADFAGIWFPVMILIGARLVSVNEHGNECLKGTA